VFSLVALSSSLLYLGNGRSFTCFKIAFLDVNVAVLVPGGEPCVLFLLAVPCYKTELTSAFLF
jgi:hypothetical protein